MDLCPEINTSLFALGYCLGLLSITILKGIQWYLDPNGYRKWKWKRS